MEIEDIPGFMASFILVTWLLLTWFWGTLFMDKPWQIHSTFCKCDISHDFIIFHSYCLLLGALKPYKRLWQHAEFVQIAARSSRCNGADQSPYFP
jgi:hypothetical protein